MEGWGYAVIGGNIYGGTQGVVMIIVRQWVSAWRGAWRPGKFLFLGEGLSEAWERFFSLDFERYFFRSSLRLLGVWNPLWTLLVSLFWGEWDLSSLPFRWTWALIEATMASAVALLVMAAFQWSDRRGWWIRVPFLGRPGGGKYLVLMAVLVPPGIILSLHGMIGFINLIFPGDPMKAQFHWDYYGKGVFGGWLLLLEFFIFKSWQDTRDEARLSQLKARELEKERLQALLNQLKDQMNPHFLFNTLNTVAALIPENPSKAEQVVVKLSALLQGILASTRRTHHSLTKELEFCGDYLEIEQVRFGQRLNWRLSVDPSLDPTRVEVPVLLLQPIVENAVKHGLSSLASGGNIWIKVGSEEKCLFIQVIDDGVGFGKSPYSGSGTALPNCRKRIELAYGQEGKLDIQNREGGGTRITLRLPLDQTTNKGGVT